MLAISFMSLSTVLYVLLVLLLLIVLLYFVMMLLYGSKPTPKLIYRTFIRDVRVGLRLLPMLYFLRKMYEKNASVGKLFQQQVKKHPSKNCILFEDETWTFKEVEDYSNQVANAFIAAGYQKGDEIALFMENRPEYICIWLGLSKIGVVSALINTNLRLHVLAHSLNAITPKAIIFNANLAPAVKNVVLYLDKRTGIDFICLDPMEKDSSFDVLPFNLFLQNKPKTSLNETRPSVGFKDKLFYIYTSGTTGLPKAAVIRHNKFIYVGSGVKFLMKLQQDDIFYNCLPLYHSSGAMTFTSVTMIFGGTVAISKKFSASNFWKDSIKYKATVAQYIGEICRFLLSKPKSPEETQHNLKQMIGNGLRPQIWEEFQKRFHIPKIVEFYAATEGNASLVNMFGKVGAVGFISRLFSEMYPAYLIKVDSDTGEPLRNEYGFCIPCEPGEPGALVGKIRASNHANSFDGYVDESATSKKVITNCLKKGDNAFHSGDIFVMDEDGYLYFVDRTGDTFRWRGENVSTTEVETVISKALGLATCVVYGVEIPGTEGKAGMAAIQLEADVDMTELHKNISASLPKYAIPVFIRICKEIKITDTYKLRKVNLRKEGFNPVLISDPIFMFDDKTHSYVQLDGESYNSLMRGETKL